MGLNYRKRVKIGPGLFLNIGKNGISSVSQKIGNVTFNSKGTTTINLGGGISYSLPAKKKKK